MPFKLLIETETGKKYLVRDLQEEFHTTHGIIKSADLKSNKTEVRSSKNHAFQLIEAGFIDLWEQLQRGPQIMMPKDIGFIIAQTGINHHSTIVDAGGGSGSLCFSLANIGKEVVVYEHNAENVSLLNKNKQLLGLKNVTIKHQDIYDGIEEGELDLITLDLPEPWRVLPQAEIALKAGGFVVVYLPNLLQVKEYIDAASESAIAIIKTVELLERSWKIEKKIMRPEFQMLGHTGFLILGRKLGVKAP